MNRVLAPRIVNGYVAMGELGDQAGIRAILILASRVAIGCVNGPGGHGQVRNLSHDETPVSRDAC